MKKKMGLIAALATVVTVGGVYATWNYAETGISSTNKFFDAVSITDKVVDGAIGTFSVDTSNVSLIIDDTNNDHAGELIWAGKNNAAMEDGGSNVYVSISLTLSVGAKQAYKNNGVAIEYRLYYNETTEGAWVYESNRIFDLVDSNGVKQKEVVVELAPVAESRKVNDDGTVTWSWTITQAELASHIQLHEVALHTEAEYDAFKKALHAATIGIEVSAPDATVGNN